MIVVMKKKIILIPIIIVGLCLLVVWLYWNKNYSEKYYRDKCNSQNSTSSGSGIHKVSTQTYNQFIEYKECLKRHNIKE